jgi:hypothetical protein
MQRSAMNLSLNGLRKVEPMPVSTTISKFLHEMEVRHSGRRSPAAVRQKALVAVVEMTLEAGFAVGCAQEEGDARRYCLIA